MKKFSHIETYIEEHILTEKSIIYQILESAIHDQRCHIYIRIYFSLDQNSLKILIITLCNVLDFFLICKLGLCFLAHTALSLS